MALEELFVLVEEHTAIRRRTSSLLTWSKGSPLNLDSGRTLTADLLRLLKDVHGPKEDDIILPRIQMTQAAEDPHILVVVMEQKLVEHQLEALAADVHNGDPKELEDIPQRVERLCFAIMELLNAEENTLYPVVYRTCSQDELWNISVELDRAVDRSGRLARQQALQEAGL